MSIFDLFLEASRLEHLLWVHRCHCVRSPCPVCVDRVSDVERVHHAIVAYYKPGVVANT